MIALPAIKEHGLTAVVDLPDQDAVLTLIVRLALRQPVQVIVGGNRFNAHRLARLVRRHTVQLDQTLERIQQARPFTCYQAVELLKITRPTSPLVILDLLNTFYDEDLSDSESFRLTAAAAAHLQRLSQQTPVLVTLRPSPTPARAALIQVVQKVADHLYIYEETHQEPYQPPLF